MDLSKWVRANLDRVGAIACLILGALVLYLGYRGTSRTAYPAEQMPYIISGGVGGALLVAMAAVLLLSADMRDEWRKLDRLEQRLDEVLGERSLVDDAPSIDGAATSDPADSDEGHIGVEATDANGRRRRMLVASPKA